MIRTTNIIPVDSNTQNYTYSLLIVNNILNEEQYFLNQKVVASSINESLNNLDGSSINLLYLLQNLIYHL